jgi:choline dehydrogenase
MGTAADWGDITTAQADAGPLPYPRGRALGGSGAINAMAHIRGHRAVYDAWAAHGAAGWDYEDLLPYFCRSEHTEGRHPVLRGTEGPVRVAPVPEPERHPVAVAFAAALAQAGCPATADSAAPSKREWPGLTWLSTAGSGSARLMPT